MKFQHAQSYAAPPHAVGEMLRSAEFRERVCQAMDLIDWSVEVDGDVVVVEQQRSTEDLPSFARKFAGDSVRIVQREEWTTPTSARVEVTIPGKPGEVTGTAELTAEGDGTEELLPFEVSVRIPLIGGRIEQLVGDLIRDALETEHRVGQEWLAEGR